MRTSVISFGILLLMPATLADSFSGQKVMVGKKTCYCSFKFFLDGDKVNVRNSMLSCDKKCSGSGAVELGGDGMNFYAVTFSVQNGRGKIRRATVVLGVGSGEPPCEVPSSSNISVSCDQLKNMHLATVHARLAYHCPDIVAIGEETDCDRNILQHLMECRTDDQYCAFDVITLHKQCFPEHEPEAICNTLHRSNNFFINARKAFCSAEPDDSSGCSAWEAIKCTAKIIAAGAQCLASSNKFECILNILDNENLPDCVSCICKVIGICNDPVLDNDIPDDTVDSI